MPPLDGPGPARVVNTDIVESATYGVSKHGAVAFAEWLSIAYGRKGLRVSCLCPQAVMTNMWTGDGACATMRRRLLGIGLCILRRCRSECNPHLNPPPQGGRTLK